MKAIIFYQLELKTCDLVLDKQYHTFLNLFPNGYSGGKERALFSSCFIRLYRFYLRARMTSFESLQGLLAHALCPEVGQLSLPKGVENRTCSTQSEGLISSSFSTLAEDGLATEEYKKEKTLSRHPEYCYSENPEKVHGFMSWLDFSNIYILAKS